MSLKVGIVGLPNVGKSTLFNALLRRAKAQVENRPFTTIEPNIGIVNVPDERLQKLFDIVTANSKTQDTNSKPISNSNIQLPKIVPATVEFVDIAGLVRGAHRGEGLGNQFLSHIREVDAIVHVVRFFENENIIHTENNVNPKNDFDTINIELILSDLAVVAKLIAGAQTQVRSNNPAVAKMGTARLTALQKIETGLIGSKPAREIELGDSEKELIKQDNLLTLKPVLIVANVSESQLVEADELVLRFLPEVEVLPLCAQTEAELSELTQEDASRYLQSIGQGEPGLNKFIANTYKLLGLQTFFTAGPKEIRAWTTKIGAKAPQAAGAVHTDFEKGFIKAEIISYEDYLLYNGEQGAKPAGKLRLEGKDCVVKDGDVCHFRFSV